MKKRWSSHALALALCWGLAIPAAAAADRTAPDAPPPQAYLQGFTADGAGTAEGEAGAFQTPLRLEAATPVPGTYGPYTISGASYDGTAYTVTFSAAKVEQKTVQIRDHYDIDDSYSEYRPATVTLVTIRPDTSVTVLEGYFESGLGYMVPVEVGFSDGNDRFTAEVFGVVQYIKSGTGKKSYEWDLAPDYVQMGDHLIYEDASAAQGTQNGFTDVKAGDYYADAVKWAVDQKITSGTSATTFSPDRTCTTAQILTFLWNANGSPAPGIRNPFADVSSGDYYYKPALWACEKGLVSGSSFRPDDPCTRADTVMYLWKLAGCPETAEGGSYAPVTLTDGGGSIQFDAAIVKKATVHERADDGNISYPATLIQVRPDSRMTLGGALRNYESELFTPEAPFIYVAGYYGESGELLAEPPMGAPPLYEGVIRDGWPAEYATYDALKLLSVKDPDGDPYFLTLETSRSALDAIEGSVSSGFTDIDPNSGYEPAIAWAVEKGIASGTSAGKFSPNGICTRGQIATFLFRAYGNETAKRTQN